MSFLNNVPPGPRGVPILGSLMDYRKSAANFLLETRFRYGPISRIKMGPYIFNLVACPSAVKRVLIDNHSNYQRGVLYKQFERVMGRGLLTMDEAEWKPHRRAIQPAFTKLAISHYYHVMCTHTDHLIDRWTSAVTSGKPVDLIDESLRIAASIVLESALSADAGLDDRLLRRIVTDSIDVMFPSGKISENLPHWLPTLRNCQIRRNRKHLLRFAQEIVDYDRGNSSGVLHAISSNMPEMPLREIKDELLTIYLAGHETTAMGLCWALITLAARPDLAARLAEELGSGELRQDGTIDVDNLKFLDAFVSEVLRLYPPIWVFPRDAIDDDVLAGYSIERGTSLLLSPLVVHRDPDIWDNPLSFSPDRFLTETIEKGAYFPFGFGMRQCVGKAMALMEMKVIIAAIIQHFDIQILPSSILSYGDALISLRPSSKIWLKVSIR